MYRFLGLSRDTPPPGAPVLGIEVAPEHAALCTLGNLSGAQHLGSWKRGGELISLWNDRAAVDIATEVPLPPDGTTLALGRVDLDTVAAMAVLVLLALGLWPANEGPDHDSWQAWRRLQRISARATYRPSADWTPRPLPTKEQPWPAEPRTWDEDRELAAVAAICGAPLPPRWASAPHPWQEPDDDDVGLSIAERVAIVACWLLWGEPAADAERWGHVPTVERIENACGVGDDFTPSLAMIDARARVEASRLALAKTEMHGVIEHRDRLGCYIAPAAEVQQSAIAGRRCVAIVYGPHPEALALGFCVAPVVVLVEPRQQTLREHYDLDAACHAGSDGDCDWRGCPQERDGELRKSGRDCPLLYRRRRDERPATGVTIAGWAGPDGQTRYLDIDALYLRLHALEWHAAEGILANAPGPWVGQDNVIRAVATLLSEEAIVREAVACLSGTNKETA